MIIPANTWRMKIPTIPWMFLEHRSFCHPPAFLDSTVQGTGKAESQDVFCHWHSTSMISIFNFTGILIYRTKFQCTSRSKTFNEGFDGSIVATKLQISSGLHSELCVGSPIQPPPTAPGWINPRLPPIGLESLNENSSLEFRKPVNSANSLTKDWIYEYMLNKPIVFSEGERHCSEFRALSEMTIWTATWQGAWIIWLGQIPPTLSE